MREQENFLNENVNHEGDDVSLSSEIFENVKEDKIEILHNEITNLIKNLKPDGVESEDYTETVMSDLFEDVKKIQINEGRLMERPQQTYEDAVKLLKSRLYSLLDKARNYKEKNPPEPEIVKKAKLALLIDDDFYQINLENEKHPHNWDIMRLKNHLVGYDRKERLAASDIDSLMNSKYSDSMINSSDWYFIDKSEATCEIIPKSLIIGIAQSQAHRFAIKDALESAETEMYDDETLEQLLASGYARDCFENYTKFKSFPIEKIIKSGLLESFNDFAEKLLSQNFEQSYIDYYLAIYPKFNNPSDDFSYKEEYKSSKQGKVLILPYKKTSDEIREIDDNDIRKNNEELVFRTISRLLEEGNVSFIMNRMYTELKKFSEINYQKFKISILKNNQEHLVLDLLLDKDKIEYINKLVLLNNEYRIPNYLKKLPIHSFGYEVYTALKKKNFIPTLRGDLTIFKNIPESEALEFINEGKAKTFLNNFSSFNVSPEFLKLENVQNACFKEFERNLEGFNEYTARQISENIHFSQSRIDAALIPNITKNWIQEKRIERVGSIIKNFPHIRQSFETKDFQKKAYNDLLTEINTGYFSAIQIILQYFPISKERFHDPQLIASLEKLILKKFDIYSSEDNIFESYYKKLSEIEKIASFVPLPAYIFQAKKVVELFQGICNPKDESEMKENIQFQDKDLQVFFVRNITTSPTPQATYLKLLKLYGEVKEDSVITSSASLILLYIEKFDNSGTAEEKHSFIQKIKFDIASLSDNQPASFSEDREYYKSLLQVVYPKRNYDSYKYLDQYENRSHDLDKYIYNKDGYKLTLSGVLGYKIKEDEIPDPEIIKQFSEHISRVKNLAQGDNLLIFLDNTVENSVAVTLEGKILEYFKQKGYTTESMNILLAYQLIGSYEDFVASSTDRLSLEESQVAKNYILLDELVNLYGDTMKETIKKVQSRVVNSIDGEKFTDNLLEKEKENYSKIGKSIQTDLLTIPQDKLTDLIIQKKILKSIKNSFQTSDSIKGRAEYFASLFNLTVMDNFLVAWSRHIDELFILNEHEVIDMKKIESLQSSVFLKLQKEIGKYEEIKEVDMSRNEAKLKKSRDIKGYFSKNKENALARMVGDVCTANDPDMLKNEKYFEFVLFDEERKKCMGTTMLLEMNEPNNKKYLLYCPNPSVGLVSEVSAKKLYHMLTKQISQFAEINNFDAVLVKKDHGLSTNRSGLFQQSLEQSCLRDRDKQEIIIDLKNPHSLSNNYVFKDNLQVVWMK